MAYGAAMASRVRRRRYKEAMPSERPSRMSHGSRRPLRRGAWLLRGQRGARQAHTLRPEGRETALFTATAGQRFAEALLFADSYHCDAVTESVVACFSKSACLAQLRTDAAARLDLTADLVRQVMSLRARLTLRDIRSAREARSKRKLNSNQLSNNLLEYTPM